MVHMKECNNWWPRFFMLIILVFGRRVLTDIRVPPLYVHPPPYQPLSSTQHIQREYMALRSRYHTWTYHSTTILPYNSTGLRWGSIKIIKIKQPGLRLYNGNSIPIYKNQFSAPKFIKIAHGSTANFHYKWLFIKKYLFL